MSRKRTLALAGVIAGAAALGATYAMRRRRRNAAAAATPVDLAALEFEPVRITATVPRTEKPARERVPA